MSARVSKNRCKCRSSAGRRKTWYRNYNAALGARDTSRQRAAREGAPDPDPRIYRCPISAGWHLTGQLEFNGDTTTPRSGDTAA